MARIRSRSRTLASLAIVLICSGCPASNPPNPSGGQGGAVTPLRIAAASDLQTALPILAERFRDRTGLEFTLTFGASGQLAEQIKAGAPFDVFLAANQSFVQDLGSGGFVQPTSIHPYARGSLVLAVRQESGEQIAGLADLTKPAIKKIALANPATAPYGAAGKQALERAGLWAKLEPKIVPAESVRQALQFVQSGNAEAGLVGRALANLPEIQVVEVEPSLYDPIVQALGVVTRTKRTKDAEKFAAFVLGDEGQRVLKEAGFASPPSESEADSKSKDNRTNAPQQ